MVLISRSDQKVNGHSMTFRFGFGRVFFNSLDL